MSKPLVACTVVRSVVTLLRRDDRSVTYEMVMLTPEEAHELADGPKVEKRVVEKRMTPTGWMPVSWEIVAVGFVEQEAIDAHSRAVEEAESQIMSRP